MPTFSASLEKALHQALTYANERHHEYATLEHLLLALIDDADAAAVMGACNVNLDVLRKTVTDYVDHDLAILCLSSFRRRSLSFHVCRSPVLAFGFTVRAAFRIKKQLKTC